MSVSLPFLQRDFTDTTYSAGAMRKSNILCKSLATVESLGAVSVIASDKTGTLTQNKMTAVNVAFGGNMELSVKEATAVVEHEAPGSACIRSLAAVAGICNDAVFDVSSGEIPNEDTKVNGDATGKLASRWHYTVPCSPSTPRHRPS